jgi:hypothetical protein
MNCAIPAEKKRRFRDGDGDGDGRRAAGDGDLRPNANCLRQIYAVTARTK